MTHFRLTNEDLGTLKQHPAVEDFIAVFQALANKKRDIIRKLRDLKEETKRKNANKNVVKSLSWLGMAAGGLLSFTPLFPVGIAMFGVSSAASVGNDLHSYKLSNRTQNRIRTLAAEDRDEITKCQDLLTRFSECAEELAKNYGFIKKYGAAILLASIVSGSTKTLGIISLYTVKDAGTCFTTALGVASKCPKTLADCCKFAQAVGTASGYGFVKVLPFLSAGTLIIEAPFVLGSWFVSPDVNDIDKTIEQLQNSIAEISKFIYELSEKFRAGL